MSIPDLINGVFESCGGFFILKSIHMLHKSKKVSGISALHVAFFASWGFWNLFYYSNLHQWVSFFGGLGVVLTNTYWLGQIVYYLNREKPLLGRFVRYNKSGAYRGLEVNFPFGVTLNWSNLWKRCGHDPRKHPRWTVAVSHIWIGGNPGFGPRFWFYTPWGSFHIDRYCAPKKS